MTRIVLALALAIATLATAPAVAAPHCQGDLGYGCMSSFGCGPTGVAAHLVPRFRPSVFGHRRHQ